jgi:hypothetical protein
VTTTAAPSSSSLLANLRRAAESGHGGESGKGEQGAEDEPAVTLASRVFDFIRNNGGSADSNAIVGHFQSEISGTDISLFKKLLRGIATKQDSRWVLKEDF